ncbi:MAG: recombinase family protein [Rubrivivax sp.]|nr:recombinase family protein [Rubrivivax sp.]
MQRVAWSYVRFSTKGQFSGDSLTRQISKAREYAKKHDLLLDESTYHDYGMSAFRGKNAKEGLLGAFLKAVDDGLIPSDAILLVESLDRISRANIMDALPLFMSIINRGVTLVTLADGEKVYTRDAVIKDNGMSLFGSMMVLIRAHEESATKSMRVKSAKASALKAGKKHGKCPVWLKPTEDRLGHTIIEEQANIVREVFSMRAQSVGSLRIAQHLNRTYGWTWGSPQVARLLQNPAVIGTRVSQAGYEPLLDHYPAIISKAEFYDVQQLMSGAIGTKRGRRADDEPNIFTGLLFCAHCGSRLRFSRASKTVTQRYVRCEQAINGKRCDFEGYVNYDALEKEVIGWLLLDQDDDFVALLDKKPARKVVSDAEVKALKEQQARLIDLAASGVMNARVITEKLNALEMQIRHHETTLVEPEADDRMFAEKAWALVERHEDATFAVADGENPQTLYAVRRELKAAFHRSLRRINVFAEHRIEDTVHCKFSVQFRGYDGEPVREYKRPALNNVKGVLNGR